MAIRIYTDGACSGNPGPGGWGVLIIENGTPRELCGGEADTTNNRMEMRAAIEALKAVPKGAEMTLVTDSEYVMKGITEWLDGWKKRGWKTASKKPVKNVDLWQELDAHAQQHKIKWEWVRGHTGDEGNERADALANQGMADYQNG